MTRAVPYQWTLSHDKIAHEREVVGVGYLRDPEAPHFNAGAVEDEVELTLGSPAREGWFSQLIGIPKPRGGLKELYFMAPPEGIKISGHNVWLSGLFHQ